MKFENILHIYWTKGIFICTKLYYFDDSLSRIISVTPGISSSFTRMVRNRFEISSPNLNNRLNISQLENNYKFFFKRPLNLLISQILSVNNNISYLIRLRIIYQYLLKTYIGKCHAVGKPVKGQRTWSNSWTSYNTNNTLRVFISSTKKKSNLTDKTEKINFKMTDRKSVV